MVKFPDHSRDYMATIGTFQGGGWYLAKYGNSPKWGRQGSARFEPGFDLTALRFRELGVALGLSVKSVNFPGHPFPAGRVIQQVIEVGQQKMKASLRRIALDQFGHGLRSKLIELLDFR